jgi:hypothetical protein
MAEESKKGLRVAGAFSTRESSQVVIRAGGATSGYEPEADFRFFPPLSHATGDALSLPEGAALRSGHRTAGRPPE